MKKEDIMKEEQTAREYKGKKISPAGGSAQVFNFHMERSCAHSISCFLKI